jgi:molybdenum cofactor synthesis domain-containing protein
VREEINTGEKMKEIKTAEAVGHILCHDLTQIIPGEIKDARFRKGHIIKEEDIPVLLSMGKEHLYVWENDANMMHENDAAEILYKICAGDAKNIVPTEIKEGKIKAIADVDGLLLIDKEKLFQINSIEQIIIATRHGEVAVKKGDTLALTRVIPLVIDRKKMKEAEGAAGDKPILSLLPFVKNKIGLVTTGEEILSGKIQDRFKPIVEEKLKKFGAKIEEQIIVGDETEKITKAILELARSGADMIFCTGGMSVDPDDRTPLAIKNTGTNIVTYGTPIAPGTMFLLSYLKHDGREIPVCGLPGCVMFDSLTTFDFVLPHLAAGNKLSRDFFIKRGYGGLCLGCETCTPDGRCAFAKG